MNNLAITVDATGLLCPMPLLKIKQALRKANQGDTITLRTNDATSVADIPRWLSGTTHKLLQVHETPQGVFLLSVRCGA